MRVEFSITAPIKSVNRTRGEHWAQTRRRRQMVKDEIYWELHQAGLPRPVKKVHATAVMFFPVRRDRDEGNFRAELEKALGDALQAGGWLSNDTPEHFTFGAVTFDKGPTRTDIKLEVSP